MFRDRINEERKRLNISIKTMSDTSKLHLPEETIRRVLSGKTADPGIGTLIDIAETVNLKPHEIFMDATTANEFQAFLDLKTKNDATEAEHIRVLADNENLKATNIGLVDKVRVLEMQLAHAKDLVSAKTDLLAAKDALIETKEELLATYRLNTPIKFH